MRLVTGDRGPSNVGEVRGAGFRQEIVRIDRTGTLGGEGEMDGWRIGV